MAENGPHNDSNNKLGILCSGDFNIALAPSRNEEIYKDFMVPTTLLLVYCFIYIFFGGEGCKIFPTMIAIRIDRIITAGFLKPLHKSLAHC